MGKARIQSLEEAYEAAVQLVARKARTTHEVADALLRQGASPEDVASVVGRLQAHRHLDDAVFAFDEAFALIDGKGWAAEAAVQILRERGVAEQVARDAVIGAREGRSDRDLCARALDRRLHGKALAPDQAPRHARALARLGHEEEVVAWVIEAALRGAGEGA